MSGPKVCTSLPGLWISIGFGGWAFFVPLVVIDNKESAIRPKCPVPWRAGAGE